MLVFYCAVLYFLFNILFILDNPSIFSLGLDINKHPIINTLPKENFSLLYTETNTNIHEIHNFTISYNEITKQLQFRDNKDQIPDFQRPLTTFDEQNLKKIIILNGFFEFPNSFTSDNRNNTEYNLTIILGSKMHSVSWSDNSFYVPVELFNIANAIKALAFEKIFERYNICVNRTC
jgi:hypothetical protein